MGARLLLGDPALVDQALHEGVVLGELGERVVAEQVATAVADVGDADPAAVEEGRGDRRTGAVERGILLDQLGDAVVGAVDRPGERFEHVLRGRFVEPADRLDRGAAGDVTAGSAADPVGDDEQVWAREAGVLVVLADAPDVGQRGVAPTEGRPLLAAGRRVGLVQGIHGVHAVRARWPATSSARGWSCRSGPGCRPAAWWAG